MGHPSDYKEIPFPTAQQDSRPRPKTRLIKAAIGLGILGGLLLWTGTSKTQIQQFRHHGRRLEERYRDILAKREKHFLSIPTGESAHAASIKYGAHPHLAGSDEDASDAKVILDFFQSELGITPPDVYPLFQAGSEESRGSIYNLTSRSSLRSGPPTTPKAWIDVYYPILNTGLDRSLDILSDEDDTPVWSAELEEIIDPLDESAYKYRDSVPAWHGLSHDGDVTGQVVYVNYGTREDYQKLVADGIDLTGKIVLARYGAVFRGLKIKGAEELGAVGVLIYSDPRDNGLVTVENGYAPYPQGPALNPTSVQRGSVEYLSIYPGDPATPGYPAYENATHVDGGNIPKIPSIPISWANAQRILEEIEEFSEGSTLVGQSSTARVRLVNHVDTKVTPIWNTVAAIPGHITDEVVVLGCHRDAWVMGAADPISGTVSLHEVVRGFGALLKKGWKPLRTILIVSWDAEEYGLVGSTEFGEDFADWLSQYAVAYINVDVSSAGSHWTASGSPSLAHVVQNAALAIPHPVDAERTLWDARDDIGPFFGTDLNAISVDEDVILEWNKKDAEAKAAKSIIGALGSGSDYTVFLQRLGIPSTDQGFSGTPSDAVYHYHSLYDSVRWQEVYADPTYSRHVAIAKHLGLMVLRIVDNLIIPLNTTQYAVELDYYLDKVQAVVPETMSPSPDFSSLRKAIAKLQSASLALDQEKYHAEKNFFHAFSKLHQHGKCHGRGGFLGRIKRWVGRSFSVDHRPHRYHDVSISEPWVSKLLESLNRSDEEFDEALSLHEPSPRKDKHFLAFIKAVKRVSAVNKRLLGFERGFISKEGIPDRTWYRHLGVAPGKWLGYGATTFPALTESLTIKGNVTLAQYEAGRLEELLKKMAKDIHV